MAKEQPKGDKKKEAKKKGGLQEIINNLSKNERTLAYAAGAILLLVILDRLILGPIQGKIKSLDEQIIQQKSIARDGLMILAYKDRISKSYTEIKKYFSTERKSQDEEFADFFKDMENISGNAGVDIVVMNRAGEPEVAQLYTQYEIKMEGFGAIENVINFIHKLTSSEKPTKVENIELIPPKKGAAKLKYTMTVSRRVLII